MKRLKLAACGLHCTECSSYKVTMEHDREAAEELVGWYRSMGWIGKNEDAEAVMRKIPLCKGCWNTTEDCFFKSGCHPGRDFRICCTEKQLDHCGEFPCDAYKEFVGNLDHHKKAMEYLLSLRANAERHTA